MQLMCSLATHRASSGGRFLLLSWDMLRIPFVIYRSPQQRQQYGADPVFRVVCISVFAL